MKLSEIAYIQSVLALAGFALPEHEGYIRDQCNKANEIALWYRLVLEGPSMDQAQYIVDERHSETWREYEHFHEEWSYATGGGLESPSLTEWIAEALFTAYKEAENSGFNQNALERMENQ